MIPFSVSVCVLQFCVLLTTLFVQCWSEEAEDRPTYPEIVQLLESLEPPVLTTPLLDDNDYDSGSGAQDREL
jgi:hypothetical protein